ncbi:IS3 family transposase, partial [Nocardiopsis sp. LOL_012]|uniref:IS3 family transposase n=1 Tax=Nocardiopsis sp. LOL_012 TaxID=3345409 RepID=UPI003A888E40
MLSLPSRPSFRFRCCSTPPAWRGRRTSTTGPARAALIPRQPLKDAIATAFKRAKGRYGHRRVHTVLTRQGWKVARKTVLALMREAGLVCGVRRRRNVYLSYRGQIGRTAANVLDRNFAADAPARKWVTDVTEFSVGGEKVYLSP